MYLCYLISSCTQNMVAWTQSKQNTRLGSIMLYYQACIPANRFPSLFLQSNFSFLFDFDSSRPRHCSSSVPPLALSHLSLPLIVPVGYLFCFQQKQYSQKPYSIWVLYAVVILRPVPVNLVLSPFIFRTIIPLDRPWILWSVGDAILDGWVTCV